MREKWHGQDRLAGNFDQRVLHGQFRVHESCCFLILKMSSQLLAFEVAESAGRSNPKTLLGSHRTCNKELSLSDP